MQRGSSCIIREMSISSFASGTTWVQRSMEGMEEQHEAGQAGGGLLLLAFFFCGHVLLGCDKACSRRMNVTLVARCPSSNGARGPAVTLLAWARAPIERDCSAPSVVARLVTERQLNMDPSPDTHHLCVHRRPYVAPLSSQTVPSTAHGAMARAAAART